MQALIQRLRLAGLVAGITLLTGGCGPGPNSGQESADQESAQQAAEPSVVYVRNGRFKLPLPGKTVSAGYFELHNPTEQPLILVGVHANVGSSVEIHRTVRNGDQVRMERLQQIEVAAGGSVAFEPGSYHLMLFGVETLPEQSEVTLDLDDGQTLTATFAAERW